MSEHWWSSLPNETLTETAWERQMNLAGIEAFERNRYTASGELRAASESHAGQKLMRKLVDVATDAIDIMQKEEVNKHRVERSLKATALIVPADTCALITLKLLIDRTYTAPEADVGYNHQTLCKEVAKAVELELNFRNWIQKSREGAVAYAKAHGRKPSTSMAEKLIAEQGAGPRQIAKWRKTFSDLSEYRWSSEELLYCGEAMIKTICDVLPDHFQIVSVNKITKFVNHVRMTEQFRMKFTDIETKVAHMQVVKKPMLTRPKPWRKA